MEVFVESLKTTAQKCPRCWKYHFCELNPRLICDACCAALLEGNAADFGLSEEDGALLVRLQDDIRESFRQQQTKFSC